MFTTKQLHTQHNVTKKPIYAGNIHDHQTTSTFTYSAWTDHIQLLINSISSENEKDFFNR